MSQDVIELNGKRYDAITGAYLGKSTSRPLAAMSSGGKVIDGFIRPSHQPAKPRHVTPKSAHKPPLAHHITQTAVAGHLTHKHKVAQPHSAPQHHHSGAKHLTAHRPERSKTLMRRAVHKPSAALKPAIKPQAPAEIMAKPHSALVRKRSALQVDPARVARAGQVNRHGAVARFRPARTPLTHRPVPVIPVRAEPPKPTPRPQPAHHQAHTDIFEAAMARARSHEQPAHQPRAHRRHRRLVNTLAIIGTFLIIGGFIGYLNLPNLQLKFASMEAGFSATLPSYTPTGYGLAGGIKRSGGTISLHFRSGSSSYTITQQASDWTSQTLLDNTLALDQEHKTVQENGQTIYIYKDGASAAWMNGGVRYDLRGNAELSTNDITAIASSL